MFCTFTLTFSVVCVQCTIWLFFFWQFLNFVPSLYVAQVLSELFWNGSSRLYYYWCYFCFQFHIPAISIMRSLLLLLLSSSSSSLLCDIWDSRRAVVNTILNFYIYEGQGMSWVVESLLAYKEHLSSELVDEFDIIRVTWMSKGEKIENTRNETVFCRQRLMLWPTGKYCKRAHTHTHTHTHVREFGFVNMWTCRKQ